MQKVKKYISLMLICIILMPQNFVFAESDIPEAFLNYVAAQQSQEIVDNTKNEVIRQRLDLNSLEEYKGSLLQDTNRSTYSITSALAEEDAANEVESIEIGSAVAGKARLTSTNLNENGTDSDFGIMTTALTSSDFESVINPSFKNGVSHPHLSGRNESEYVSPFDGTLQLNYTDLHLPGRNGLDLSINRFYKSEHSGVEESNAGGVYTVNPTTYFNKRYALGIGWSFGFPSVELREKYDGSIQAFYHDGTGASYRSNYNDSIKNEEGGEYYNGHWMYFSNLDNYYTDNVQFREGDRSYTREGYISEYSFKAADDTMQYFGKDGQILSIKDRFNNEITFDYVNLPGENIIPFYSHAKFSLGTGWSYSTAELTFNPGSTMRSTEALTQFASLNKNYDEYYVSLMYMAAGGLNPFTGSFKVYCDLYHDNTLLNSVLIAEETPSVFDEAVKIEGEFSIGDLDLWEVPNRARLRVAMVKSKHTIYLTDFRLSPKIPMISKITDTIGRTVVFDYQGDIYTRYADGYPTLPLTVTAYTPEGKKIRTLYYYRNRYTCTVNDGDYNTVEQHRMFFFWGCYNEEYTTWVNYTQKEGRGSTIYALDTVEKSFYFDRHLVSEAQNRNSTVYFTYEDVYKWTDNRPRGSTAKATAYNTGFIKTWRVANKYVVNASVGDTENPKYNQYQYNYSSGIYKDETGYNLFSRLPKGPGYLNPAYGVYRVVVTNPNGSQETYEYTSHTFKGGYRRRWEITLPLLDKKIIAESAVSGSDSITEEYSYTDNYAIISPNQVKTTEVMDGTTRTYYTKTEYDMDSCLPIRTSLPLTEAEAKQNEIPADKSIETVYAHLGNRTFVVTRQKYYQAIGGNPLTMSYVLDGLGRTTSMVDAQGNTTHYEYDTIYPWLASRVYFSDPEKTGEETRIAEILYKYDDAYGFGATEERVKYSNDSYAVSYTEYSPEYGNIKEHINANGIKTLYGYDKQGRLYSILYPPYSPETGGTGRMYEMNTYSERVAYGNMYAFEVTTTQIYNTSDMGVRVVEIKEDVSYYDDYGNLLYFKTSSGTKTAEEEYTYDAANRVIGYQNCFDFGTETNTQSYTYDGFDRITSATDKKGNVQKVDYKSLSNEYSFVSAGSSVAENHYVEKYDMYGRKISESVYPNGISSNALTTAYEYDLAGNVTKVTDANGKITETTYDVLNNPITIVQADGHKITNEYTKWGTVKTTSRYDGEQPYNITQTFDDRGLPLSHRQNGLEILTKPWYYTYREDGRLSQVTLPNGNQRFYEYDQAGNNTSYTADNITDVMGYDYAGLLDKITRSTNGTETDSIDYFYNGYGWLLGKQTDSGLMKYSYNLLGNTMSMTSPGSLTRTYTRDELERLTAIQVDDKEFTYEYYGDGLLKKLTYPGGMTTEYTYDNANRLKTIVTKKGSVVLKTYSYTYDGVGNILFVSGSSNISYTYDELYRLKTATENGVTTTYAYDSRDNLISEIRPNYSKTYEYGGDNRLYKVTENGVVTTYEYDLNGNLIQRGDDEFGYDANDKLVYAKVNDVVTTYDIAADNLRKSKTSNGITTTYQTDENGNVICESGHEIILGHKPLAKKIDGNYYYYIYNGHGDVVSIVDETGNVKNSYEYDAWGKVLTQNETIDNSLLYAGEYYDEETGLIYLRNRYYDPDARRFTQEDPARDGLNWYVYCENNPVNRIDPLGLESYVFYTTGKNSDFSSQAQWQKDRLENMGEKVIMIPVTDVKTFEDGWNGMGMVDGKSVDINYVMIYTHGNHRSMIFESGSSTKAMSINGKNSSGRKIGNVNDLQEKEIKELNLLSCNAGNLLTYYNEKENLASVLSKKVINGNTYAYDGNVSFGKSPWDIFGKDIGKSSRLATNQHGFNEIAKKYNVSGRKPLGKITYYNGEYKPYGYYPNTSIWAN